MGKKKRRKGSGKKVNDAEKFGNLDPPKTAVIRDAHLIFFFKKDERV